MDQIKVDIINESGLALPAYATPLASGMDLRAAIPEAITLGSLQRALIPTGLRIAVPDGYEVQIRPRSGLALKHGISLVNTPGTIDADYRGQIGVIVINLSDTPFTIEPGERIAQMVLCPVAQIVWHSVETLDETERGEGGFGHSGRK